MGSGAQTARETVAFLAARGERVGVAQVRLYRPFPADALIAALPASVRRVAVLDRTKEPGSEGEPLFLDVVAALNDAAAVGTLPVMPIVIGGRYGLSSKEFTPGMVAGVLAELQRDHPRKRFTIGIVDDVSNTSLPFDPTLDIEPPETVRAVFFGLGSDGTVGANKNTIKIRDEGLYAQAYFVYDSKKSVANRLAPAFRSRANPRAVLSLAGQLCRLPPVRPARACRGARAGGARRGAAAQLPHPPDRVWDALPPGPGADPGQGIAALCDQRRAHRSRSWAGGRINTVLQTCFFAISGIMEREQAIEKIKAAITKTYGRRGAEVVERNLAAVDQALTGLHRVQLPEQVTTTPEPRRVVPDHAPESYAR